MFSFKRCMVVVSSALVLMASAFSYAGMRCDNQLVSLGDHFEQVRKTCGDADATYDMGSRVIFREVGQGQQTLAVAESIKQDMWVYHFGPNSFSRNLYFDNGILVKIELGERG